MSVGIRRPKKIAVFISGNGSTLQAFLDMRYQTQIVIVVSNRKNTLAELKAKRYGISTFLFSKEMTYDQLTNHLISQGIELIFLAGFMKILPAKFVDAWKEKIFNIHPSLLPEFPGLNALENSFASEKDMGATIHVVTNEMDAGPKFVQQISLLATEKKKHRESSAAVFLRRTEQHVLREFVLRRAW